MQKTADALKDEIDKNQRERAKLVDRRQEVSACHKKLKKSIENNESAYTKYLELKDEEEKINADFIEHEKWLKEILELQ